MLRSRQIDKCSGIPLARSAFMPHRTMVANEGPSNLIGRARPMAGFVAADRVAEGPMLGEL